MRTTTVEMTVAAYRVRSAKGWPGDGRRPSTIGLRNSSLSLENHRQDVRDLALRGRSYQISCQHMVY
jgi:hypothetical protein